MMPEALRHVFVYGTLRRGGRNDINLGSRPRRATWARPTEYFKRDVVIHIEGRAMPCFLYEINPARLQGRACLGRGDWMAFHSS